MTTTAVSCCVLRNGSSLFCAEMMGTKMPRYLANATATAAMVPVWMTTNSVQPYRNPLSGPNASRR